MEINLKEKSIVELKSLAYDIIVDLEQMNRNLRLVNQELAERARESAKKLEEKAQ